MHYFGYPDVIFLLNFDSFKSSLKSFVLVVVIVIEKLGCIFINYLVFRKVQWSFLKSGIYIKETHILNRFTSLFTFITGEEDVSNITLIFNC